MVKIGRLPFVELLIYDACFAAMFLTLVLTSRRRKSAAVLLQMLAAGVYVALRVVEWLWQIAFDHGWMDASSIKSIYWTWNSIGKTSMFVAFTIGFCWHFVSSRRLNA